MSCHCCRQRSQYVLMVAICFVILARCSTSAIAEGWDGESDEDSDNESTPRGFNEPPPMASTRSRKKSGKITELPSAQRNTPTRDVEPPLPFVSPKEPKRSKRKQRRLKGDEREKQSTQILSEAPTPRRKAETVDEATNSHRKGQRTEKSQTSHQAPEQKQGPDHPSNVEIEEGKVKTATLKLVTWLRNRLRKRLTEVAELEANMAKGEHEIASLVESQKRVSAERQEEIKKKINSQKELAEFRLKSAEPDDQMRIVREQTEKLERQLEGVSNTYDELSATYAKLQTKIRQAGFSHWLDTRGQRYMPETAVGVLAKSAEVLEPVVAGISKAVVIDQEVAQNVNNALTPAPHSAVVTGVVADIFILVPIIPLVALACRLSFSVKGFTALHYIFFFNAMFAAQCASCFILCILFGEEVLHYYQRSNEPLMIAGLFATAAVYVSLMFLQALIAIVDSTTINLAHLLLFSGAGFYFYIRAFRPAVLNHPTDFPVLSYPVLTVLFLYVMTEKNEILRIPSPFHNELRAFFDTCHAWLEETKEAMQISMLGERQIETENAKKMDLYFSDESESEWEQQRNRDSRKFNAPPSFYRFPGDTSLQMDASRSSSFSIATTAAAGRRYAMSHGRSRN